MKLVRSLWWLLIVAPGLAACGRLWFDPADGLNDTSPRPDRLLGEVALYLFDEGGGNVVRDQGIRFSPLDLDLDPATTTWLPGALRLNTGTVVQSASVATKLYSTVVASGQLTLEAWIRPTAIAQSSRATIAAVVGSANVDVSLEQAGAASDAYGVFLNNDAANTWDPPDLVAPTGSVTSDLTHVVMTHAANGDEKMFLDGTVVTTGTRDGNLAVSGNFPLRLGNTGSAERPWLGEYHLLAIYERTLSEVEVEQNFRAGPDPEIVKP